MTISSVVRDFRVTDVGSCGTGKAGFYYRKSQDGSNWAPGEPKEHPHPYSMSLLQFHDPWIKWFDNSNPSFIRECTAYSAGWAPAYYQKWTTNHYIKLLDKLRSKMNGGEFHLGVTIAESKELWGTIALSATRVRRGLNSLLRDDPLKQIEKSLGFVHSARRVRRKKLSARDIEKDLSAKWLELSYAWMPAVQDAYNAGQKLAHLWTDPAFFSVRASKFITSQNDNVNVLYDKATQMERMQIIARFTRPGVTTALGLQDPQSVLWEKLPYSFVADWFIPIGSYLASQAYFHSLSSAQFIETYYRTRETVGVLATPLAPRTIIAGGGFWQTEIDLSRTISNSISVPLPEIKPLSSIAGWQHCVSAVALLTSRFLK